SLKGSKVCRVRRGSLSSPTPLYGASPFHEETPHRFLVLTRGASRRTAPGREPGPMERCVRSFRSRPPPSRVRGFLAHPPAYPCRGPNSLRARWRNDEGRGFLPLWPSKSLPRSWFRGRRQDSNLGWGRVGGGPIRVEQTGHLRPRAVQVPRSRRQRRGRTPTS